MRCVGPLRELSQYFCDTLGKFDIDNRGKIFVNQACDVLSTMHLTAIQVQAIVSEADCDEHQLVSWKKFSRVAAMMAFEFWGGSLPPNYRYYPPSNYRLVPLAPYRFPWSHSLSLVIKGAQDQDLFSDSLSRFSWSRSLQISLLPPNFRCPWSRSGHLH